MTMTMPRDEWVRAAMIDDMVVVQLLVRLKQSQAVAPARPPAVIPLKWGVRLPRSKSAAASSASAGGGGGVGRGGDVVSSSTRRTKDGDSSTRCSPTTPLSWSGGGGAASPSATADGFEETSRHDTRSPSVVARSKGAANAETTSTTATKRSRRKKTFAELKEEESLLLKERIYLRKELASLHIMFEEHKARNENLKKIKLDLNLHSAKDENVVSNEPKIADCRQPLKGEEASSVNHTSFAIPRHAIIEQESDFCESQNHDRAFLLPDLNMMPAEDDSNSETLYGMS